MNGKRTVVKCAVLAALAVVAVLLTKFWFCAAPAKMRVGTYNIRCKIDKDRGERAWDDRNKDFFAHVRNIDMDVFGLQEVTPEQYTQLTKAFPDYAFVGRFRDAEDFSGEAVPVYYRKSRFDLEKSGTFWLSETPDTPGSRSWGSAYLRVCTYAILRDKKSGRRFCFANTHTDNVSEEAREKGMMLVINRMKDFGKGAPIIFVGDHNCRETEVPAKAVRKILKDAIYATKTPPKGPWRTCTGWRWRDSEVLAKDVLKLPMNVRNARKGSPDADKASNGGYDWVDCGTKIDYIYVSPDVKVLTYETFADPRPGKKCYHSDHFPIVADIAL